VSAQSSCVVESFMPEYPLKNAGCIYAPGGRNVLLV